MSSTGRLKVVKVSGWGLQKTLGSGPQSWLSLQEATSRIPAQAVGLGLDTYRYLLI